MNYEEKYKQAFEIAKEVYHDDRKDKIWREWLTKLFPELKESEEKQMIERLKSCVYAADLTIEGRNELIVWLEKQGEQPTDKIDTKFKVGDWVILNSIVAKILDKQKYGFVGLDIDGKDFFCNYGHTDSMRLWTIADAKDGDVLVDKDGRPFIFTGEFDAQDDNPTAYCGINSNDKFIIGKGSHWTFKDGIKPATKEQRDLLFAKMKEAGCDWDAEKKELTKVEQDNHPRIVMADFNGGEGFYKLNLDNLNKEQVNAIEIMINNPKQGKKLDPYNQLV